MKRFMSLLLALVMVLSLTATAFVVNAAPTIEFTLDLGASGKTVSSYTQIINPWSNPNVASFIEAITKDEATFVIEYTVVEKPNWIQVCFNGGDLCYLDGGHERDDEETLSDKIAGQGIGYFINADVGEHTFEMKGSKIIADFHAKSGTVNEGGTWDGHQVGGVYSEFDFNNLQNVVFQPDGGEVVLKSAYVYTPADGVEEVDADRVIVLFENEEGEACIPADASWANFGTGDVFTVPFSQIKPAILAGGATLRVVYSGDRATWSGNYLRAVLNGNYDDDAVAWVEPETIKGGKYLSEISLDDLVANWTTSTGEDADGISSLRLQPWYNNFKLYYADIVLPDTSEPDPETEIAITEDTVFNLNEETMTLEDGAVTVDGSNLIIKLPSSVVLGANDTVKLHITGTSKGQVRSYIIDKYGNDNAQTDVAVLTSGSDFDEIFTLTMKETAGDPATHSLMIKGPAGGTLSNTTITYLGIVNDPVEPVEPEVPELDESIGLYVQNMHPEHVDKSVTAYGVEYTITVSNTTPVSIANNNYIILKSNNADCYTSFAPGTEVLINSLTIDGVAQTLKGGYSTKAFTVGANGKLEFELNLTYYGSNRIENAPESGSVVEVKFTVRNPEADAAKFVDGASAVLTDKIDFSFYTEFAPADSYVKFTFNGKETIVESDGTGTFTMPDILPVDMDKPVKAELIVDDVTVDTITYTVKDYCKAIIASASSSDSLKQLAADLLYYGAAVAEYAGMETEIATDISIAASTSAEEWEANGPAEWTSKLAKEASWKGATLVFDTTITMRLYFADSITSVDASEITVTKDGVAVEATIGKNSSGTYAEIKGFTPLDYDKDVVATYNGNTLTYSVSSYVVRMKKNSIVKNVVHAIYDYGMSAVAYEATLS